MAIPKIWTQLEINRLREEFREVDKDKNGLIDGNELKLLLKTHFGEHVDDEDVIAVMPVLSSGDDSVVFEDFVNFLTSDTSMRFDVRFIRYMREQWEDRLGLQLYIPFLMLFMMFLISGNSLGPGFWQTFALNDLVMGEEFDTSPEMRFEKFYSEIKDSEEYWQWMYGPVLNAWWSGDSPADAANGFAKYGNMPVGAMKLRQVRIEGSTCAARSGLYENHRADNNMSGTNLTVNQRLNQFPTDCYRSWDQSRRYTGSYLSSTTNADGTTTTANINTSHITPAVYELIGEALTHRACNGNNGLNGSSAMLLEGKVATYHCDGYALIIPFSWPRSKVEEALGYLQNGIPYQENSANGTETKMLHWIDLQTRALSIEMFTYNQNLNLFSRLQYVVEVTAGGAWVPVYNNINFTLFQWENHEFAYYFFMFVFFAFLCFYLFAWGKKVWRWASERMADQRTKGFLARITSLVAVLFRSFWISFDLINYTFFFTVWGLKFAQIEYGLTSTAVLENDWYPSGYETIARIVQISSYLDGINALLCVIRVLYYLRLNPQFNLLSKTLERASRELAGLLLIFFMLFIGFCLMGYIIFGQVVEDYRDVGSVVATLLRYLVGDFDYVMIREERRIMAPIFFALFQAMCFFVLLNMVIAVLSDSFTEVQEEKWRPALLESLMANTNDDYYEPIKGQTGNRLTDSALFREIAYWVKTLVLSVQNVLKVDTPEWERRYARLSQDNINRNPRLYWGFMESQIYERKSVVCFQDKLNLCLLSLEDFLVFGSETDANGFEGFGGDFEVATKSFVLGPAEKMDREPRELMQMLVESHHYWFNEALQLAEFGDPEDHHEENEEKLQMIKDMSTFNAQHKFAGFDDSDTDTCSSAETGTSSESSEEELFEEELIREEAVKRNQEQDKVMKDILARASLIHSNKQQIQDVMSRAVMSALQSRMARTRRIVRFEQGTLANLRVHRLIAARYGRYLPANAQQAHWATTSKEITVYINRNPSEPFAPTPTPTPENEDTEQPNEATITVTKGASEADTLMRARTALGLSRSTPIRVWKKKGDEEKETTLSESEVRVGERYRVEVAEGREVVDWVETEWTRGQGAVQGEWRATVPEHAVLGALRRNLVDNHGTLRLPVEDFVLGDHTNSDDIGHFSVCSESTINDYPDDYVEAIRCYSQLEVIYEPVTLFREHMENTMFDMIRKSLPNLMLSTLTTQQLMSLLESKVKGSKG